MKTLALKRSFIASIAIMIITANLFPQAPPVTSVGTATFSAGTWSVPVTVSGFTNVGNISLKLNYDPLLLTYTGVTVNAGLNPGNTLTTPVTDQTGVFSLSYTSSTAVTLAAPSNTLLTITFTVRTAAGGHTLLNWSTLQGACDITPPHPGVFTPEISASNLSTYFVNGFIDIPAPVSLKLFLEGLYTGGGVMRQAQGTAGNQHPGTVADLITVELHDALNYATLVHTAADVNLNTDGTAVFTVPPALNLSYYITIKHRNSLKTVSAAPVSFAAGNAIYDFTTQASKAFGNNMKNSAGVFLIYSGDNNQDGFIGVVDMSGIDNQSAIFASGYMPEDINGDGFVGVTDMTIIDNNSAAFISAINP